MKKLSSYILLLLVIACSKKDNVDPALDYITETGFETGFDKTTMTKIEYDAQKRPTIVRIFDILEIFGPNGIFITYKGNRIEDIVVKNYGKTTNHKIEYLSDNEVTIFSDYGNSATYFRNLVFSKEGLPLKLTTQRNSQGPIISEKIFTYNADLNLLKIEYMEYGTLLSLYTFSQHDKMKNPFYHNAMLWTIINTLYGVQTSLWGSILAISKNNPTAMNDRSDFYKHEISYNDKGFPESASTILAHYNIITQQAPNESDYIKSKSKTYFKY
ncbi:hypothetical protein [Runella sp.]|uniref:hypothetical protein n=1 Tax=Runella sp. TaxID=1960881 RepID=UPI003D117E8C